MNRAMRDVPLQEFLDAVEKAAARGQRGAERLLLHMLREEAATGELSMISRLAAKRYVMADDREKVRP
jgi:hypothetical protein